MTGAALLPEFDHEMANTRKTLERVPDDRLDFTPHEKSMSLLRLAAHLANIPSWAHITLGGTEFDLSGPQERLPLTNRAAILAHFDRERDTARAAIEKATADDLAAPWTLKAGAHVVFTQPRAGVLRTFVMNHMIHHRAQLGVYLRLLDIPVPAVYGPSADEQ